MAYLFIGAVVNHEQHIVSRLLLKFDIASTLSMLVDVFHFNHAMHGFALVFRVARVGNLRLIFEEGLNVAKVDFSAKCGYLSAPASET